MLEINEKILNDLMKIMNIKSMKWQRLKTIDGIQSKWKVYKRRPIDLWRHIEVQLQKLYHS